MNFHSRMMNIRDGADGPGGAGSEYKRGHRDARHAAAEIANEADARIAELEARLADKHDAGFIIFQALILAASGEPGISTPGNELRSAAVTLFGEDAVNKALGKLVP